MQIRSVIVILLTAGLCAATVSAPAADLLSLLSEESRQGSSVSMPAGVGRIPSDSDAAKASKPREETVREPAVVEKRIVVEKPVEKIVEKKVVVEKPVEKIVERKVVVDRPVTNTVEKIVEKKVVVEKPVEVEKVVVVERTNVVEKTVDRIVEKPVEKIVERKVVVDRPVTNTVEKIVEKRVVVERTNVVEKIVLDKSRERELLERERQLLERQKTLQSERDRLATEKKRLAEEKERLAADNRKLTGEKDVLKKKADLAEGENKGLTDANAALDAQLAKERDRLQRLERVIPKENRQFADNFLKITAPSTFYDRKEGYAVFQGGVHVHDNQYELHSKRAFVFSDPVSNVVSRIVAIENVAVTNGPQRAYGTKASYYRQTGMVILYGDAKTPAIVRDESRVDDQEIIGEKIKFWVNSQQVEILKARIKTPVDSGAALTDGLTGRR